MGVEPFFTGLMLCLGLIVAIGAQNSYVLRQGLKREHHWMVATLATVSDFALILLGTNGLGALLDRVSWLENAGYFLGACFLFFYSYRALREALKGDQAIGLDSRQVPSSVGKVMLETMGITWLNPHAWMDTTVLIGTFSMQYTGEAHWLFTLGAMTASVVWFYGLSMLASQLAAWLTKPSVWRMINSAIGIVMTYIGIRFLFSGLAGLGRVFG